MSHEASPHPDAPSTPLMAAVSIKLPPYWPADPEVWFAQVFTTKRITVQRTMFDYVVSSLSPIIATEIRDLLLKPPAEDPYEVLKAELIKRTAASAQRKLQQLISGEELGDRKPTQLLRRMQQLLGEQLGTAGDANTFLRELFLQRLPASVRMVLASADPSMSINQLADMADKVMEVASSTTISAVSHPDLPEVKQLREEVTRLADLVASLTTKQNHHRNRSRSSSRQRRLSPAPSNQTHDLCWYHHKFGQEAKKCQEPCNWGNSQAGP